MNKIILLAFLLPAFASACIPAPGVLVSLEGNYEINYSALDALGFPYTFENNTITYYSQFDDRVVLELNGHQLVAAPFSEDFETAYKQNQLIDWPGVLASELNALANAGVLVIPDALDAAECAAASVVVGKNPPAEYTPAKVCGEWKQYSDAGLKDGADRNFGCGGTLLQGTLPTAEPSAGVPTIEPAPQKTTGWLEQIISFLKSLFGIA
ncbi:MAG: hypothetical protein WC607_04180 [Candidatus Micrarchaeia archaeon]